VNRKVARGPTDVTDPAAPDPNAGSALTGDESEATTAPPAPAAPDGDGQGTADPGGADRGKAHRAGADRVRAERAGADRAAADRVGADHASSEEGGFPPVIPEQGGLPPDRGGAGRDARRSRRGFVLVLAVLVVLALIPMFVARIYVIPSGSMETTLHGCDGCDNDRVLVDKLAYRFGSPAPGDIVVFTLPDTWTSPELQIPHGGGGNPVIEGLEQLGALFGIQAADETEYIKRVIAVGGQTVACCDERNRITVDGVAHDEPYIYFLPEAGPPRQSPFGPVRVPEGELWVMGDSRNNSVDSRAAGNGPVPLTNVIGKAWFIVYPFDRLGAIPAPPAR
jgi:signal peptidase I